MAKIMAKIMAIVSQKGGVGKTSLALNLGNELAEAGKRVLIVDFDPQADLTACAGFERDEERPTSYDAMLEPHEAPDCVVKISEGFYLLPADEELSGAELEFGHNPAHRNTRLKAVMTYIADDYDYILIDCPPSLGFCTANALVAANEILVPLQCEHLALRALENLFNIVQESMRENKRLRIAGVVPTFYDRRNSLSSEIVEAAREELGLAVLNTVIPRNVDVAHASGYGLPVGKFAPKSKGALAYKALAQEVMSRD